MTPNQLAAQLGISAKSLRAYLRKRWVNRHRRYERWCLDEEQIQDAHRRLRK